MNKNHVPVQKTLLAATALGLAAAASAQALSSDWDNVNPATATYVILAPRVNGNRSLVSAGDYNTVLRALVNDSAGAIKRRYPNATIGTDAKAAGAVLVTPVLNAPSALVPWAKLSVAMNLRLPSGQTLNLSRGFGVLEVYNHRADAANYMFDELTKQLP